MIFFSWLRGAKTNQWFLIHLFENNSFFGRTFFSWKDSLINSNKGYRVMERMVVNSICCIRHWFICFRHFGRRGGPMLIFFPAPKKRWWGRVGGLRAKMISLCFFFWKDHWQSMIFSKTIKGQWYFSGVKRTIKDQSVDMSWSGYLYKGIFCITFEENRSWGRR